MSNVSGTNVKYNTGSYHLDTALAVKTMAPAALHLSSVRCTWGPYTELSVKQCNLTRHPALDVVSTSLPKIAAEPVASSKPEWRCRISGIQVGSKGSEVFENQAPLNMYKYTYLLTCMYLSHIYCIWHKHKK